MADFTLPVGEQNYLVLQGVVGSTAYGLATPDSDVDRLGVYVMPTDELFGLNPGAMERNSKTSGEGAERDWAAHEVGKYLSLALKCNPTAMELMWLPDDLYEVRTVLGDDLRGMRHAVLSRVAVRDAYMGYAVSQFARLQRRGKFADVPLSRVRKHARHLLRLLYQGTTLHTDMHLPIRLEDPQRFHDFGAEVEYAVRYGESLEFVDERLNAAREVFDGPGCLPDEPDFAKVEKFLLGVRYSHLRQRTVR